MKNHYYLFGFAIENGHASVIIGWPNRNVTGDKISEARKAAIGNIKGVLMAVSYLGEMTPEEAAHS
jgi:hypothetical protein